MSYDTTLSSLSSWVMDLSISGIAMLLTHQHSSWAWTVQSEICRVRDSGFQLYSCVSGTTIRYCFSRLWPAPVDPYIALSPNYCMLACMDGAGKITLSKMENVVGAIENNSEYTYFSAKFIYWFETGFSPEAITGLVIHNGSASSVGWQVTDDILAIFPSNFNRGMCLIILVSIHRLPLETNHN